MDNSFTKDWWFKFIEKNYSFSETKVYKNVFDKNLLKTLNEGVFEMLTSRINRLDINSGFRVYKDGIELNDSQIRQLLKGNKLKKDEDIESYCNRVFGKNFGIITNYCEKHSEILAETILKSIKPLFDIIGLPPWGIELTTFIGNYGWTPLGIHTDNTGENVLHYHLGPGKKTMHVWDEEIYKEVGKGIHNNKNIKPLLRYSNKYEFDSGDLYYMPWNKHHVGYTQEFSIGVTLWFNNPTRYNFSKLMLETIQNLFLKDDQSIIESQLNYINNDNTFSDFINTLNIDKKTMESPLKDFLKHVYLEYKKCLISNGGWQNKPNKCYKEDKNHKEKFSCIENKIIKSHNLYKIGYEKVDNRLNIYVRGARLSFKYFPELTSIIEKINHNKSTSISHLIKAHNNLPKDVIIYFLELLISNNGLKLESKNSLQKAS